jgi:uncharacterized membrane protein
MTEQSKFPHDRVVFFSDAVFAIAITLLVIEIKVPSHQQLHDLGTAAALQKLTPLFIGYFVSFLVTALFWKYHLQLGQFIKKFDNKMLWLNIALLMFVGLMPFSTALYSENFGDNAAFNFYCLNLTAIGLMSFWLTAYTAKKEKLEEIQGKHAVRLMKVRSIIVPVVFLLCIPFAMLSPLLSRFSFLLIFVFHFIAERIYKKKIQSVNS